VRTDSAGVEIVINEDVAGPDARWAKLVSPALLELGSEEDGPELFGRIGMVRLHPDGRLWLSDMLAQEVRVFDVASGEHLFTLGGYGDGPEEFRAVRPLGYDEAGDSYVFDEEHRRLTVYSRDGEIREQRPILTDLPFAPRPQHVTPDGRLMGQVPRGLVDARLADGDVLQDTVRVWIIHPDGSPPRLVAEAKGGTFYYHSFRSVVVPFSSGSRMAFTGDRAVLTDPDGGSAFTVWSADGLERRVAVRREREPVEDSDIRDYLEYLEDAGWTENSIRFYELHIPDMPIPWEKPAWEYPLVDATTGRTWLARITGVATDSTIFDVFDDTGALLGTVAVPANMLIYQVAGDLVVGTVRDEVDRVFVVVYRTTDGG
jgi:hypothetical protein